MPKTCAGNCLRRSDSARSPDKTHGRALPRKPIEPFVPLTKLVAAVPDGSLSALKRKARDCHACPLWKTATQTVFGDGPADADIMVIGEQPGLHEDIEGEPFAGPAGRMLDRAALYLTNTVKHFKYQQRGTAKLHKRANAAERAACRMWLAAELARVRPKTVVALGARAAQALFGNTFRLSRERGGSTRRS